MDFGVSLAEMLKKGWRMVTPSELPYHDFGDNLSRQNFKTIIIPGQMSQDMRKLNYKYCKNRK